MTDLTTTHSVDIGRTTVVKHYRSWDRGEPEREWRTLTLLARYAPGLAPAPLERTPDPPTVTMERLPGDPLRGTAVAPGLLPPLAAAVTRFQEAVPRAELEALPPRLWAPGDILAGVRDKCATALAEQSGRTAGSGRGSGAGPEPPDDREAALAAGARWVRNPALDALVAGEPAAPVLGFADGNLANYLWDGSRIRLVDFESSGRADRIQELAEIAEHVSVWVDSSLDADALLGHFPLTRPERARLRDLRRLAALMWLLMLDGDSRTPRPRNPPGTVARQAERLLGLLG
ncbi:phosphotransferase [Streptomyces sp. NBC_00859]|uniref:phosphotransferase n=1 Tax=Streptomyces sp. NBC_00859 TaxID=2903682 RepID=UPI003867838D|nr:aminoglycoside phosphotransferase family protein [Streptomyces sp. NBC_00859]